jgi:monoamine oxidase
MSGMSTAAALQREGIDFLVLEARNYTGGRMHAFSFGDSSVGKFMVESCANWVQGGEPNVVYKAAKKIGLRMSKEPGSDQNFTNYPEIYDENGHLQNITDVTARLNKAATCVRQLAQSQYAKAEDMRLRDALTQCNWTVHTSADAVLDFFSFQGEFATVAEQVA